MIPISVCIIAKNEERNVEECLKCLGSYGLEIIFTDTGSTDRTVALAARYTDKIYHFDWCNDFSAARNFTISKASNDWILSLDCDEYLQSFDADALQRQLLQFPQAAGRVLLRNRFMQGGVQAVENVRVSRLADRRFFRFYGAVHEQLESVSGGSQSGFDAPIEVLHTGYDLSEAEMQKKAQRNISLLEKELLSNAEDPYLYYQLGQSYRRLKQYEKALTYFNAGLALEVNPELDYVQSMVESYGYTLLDLNLRKEALQLVNIYDVFCRRADFPFLMGFVYMNNGLFAQAITEFQKAAQMKNYSIDGVNSYKAWYNIGVICECTGDLKKAKQYYLQCGDYAPAKARLAALC